MQGLKIWLPESSYRKELKHTYGTKFLEYRHLRDANNSEKISQIKPQCVYLAGFHQDADRIAVLDVEDRSLIIV
jgi:hypothetical protein